MGATVFSSSVYSGLFGHIVTNNTEKKRKGEKSNEIQSYGTKSHTTLRTVIRKAERRLPEKRNTPRETQNRHFSNVIIY